MPSTPTHQAMDETQPTERDKIREKLEAALQGRYVIERPLGEGGMAFVYLGKDAKHDREVAIKVLKPELAASLGGDRFLREIQITAKLQHPNILPLYDSGDADGLLYYVMPFVVGESLSDLIEREKQLSIHDAVQIAREVAEALAYAHSYGLIHRDIKPDNVMMSNGHAIVADFGIARAMSEAGADKLTQTGMAVGTPAYMSPEQAAGDPGVDNRADIYSVGCVLYEMLVGQIPFTGPNAMAIMARHTMDHVTPPSIMRQSVPPEVEDVVFKAMEKLPADRYRTAHEMVEALKAIEQGRVSTPTARASQMAMRQSQMGMRGSQIAMRQSQLGLDAVDLPARRRWPLVAGIGGAAVVVAGIAGWALFGRDAGPVTIEGGLDPRDLAVLYFEDTTPDSSLGHVADGITEGLIDQLGQVPELRVLSRNAVEQFRGSGLSWDSIARTLGAGTIVAGSVDRVGAGLRVSTRLVDGSSGVDLRDSRQSFQVAGNDALAARDSAVERVAAALRRRIGEEVRILELQAGTRNTDAWTLVQRGSRLRKEADDERDPDAKLALLDRADSLLRLATTADPEWAQPRIERGWVALDRARAAQGRAAVPYFDRAVALADTVLARRPGNAEALELRGTTRSAYYQAKVTDDQRAWERLKTGAREDLEAAIAADPTSAAAHLALGQLLYLFEDVPGALLEAQRALREDAYLENADDVLYQIFFGLIDTKQFRTAKDWCERGAARFPTDPRFVNCDLFLLATPGFPPDPTRAWQLRARLDSLDLDSTTTRPFFTAQANVLIGGILARAGSTDSAHAVWQRTRDSILPLVPLAEVGQVQALEAYTRTLAGDMDEAIDLLKRAVAANPDHDFASTAGQYWWWDELRKSPRWREIAGGR